MASKRQSAADPRSIPKRVCAAKGENASAFMCMKQTPRGMHTAKTVPPPESLFQVIKDRSYSVTSGQYILNKYIERNTTYTIQKAIALNIFSIAILEGDEILAACRVASKFTGFSAEVIHRWACTTYVEYFGKIVNIDDIDDEEISILGAFPYLMPIRLLSLFMDEEFQFDAREYVRSVGYVKGAPNMTLMKFVGWVEEKWGVQVSKETARTWLHN